MRTEEQIRAEFIRTLADKGLDYDALPPTARDLFDVLIQVQADGERLIDSFIAGQKRLSDFYNAKP